MWDTPLKTLFLWIHMSCLNLKVVQNNFPLNGDARQGGRKGGILEFWTLCCDYNLFLKLPSNYLFKFLPPKKRKLFFLGFYRFFWPLHLFSIASNLSFLNYLTVTSSLYWLPQKLMPYFYKDYDCYQNWWMGSPEPWANNVSKNLRHICYCNRRHFAYVILIYLLPIVFVKIHLVYNMIVYN